MRAFNARNQFVPSEILNEEKFIAMSARAKYCNVKKLKDGVKLKLRTAKNLYTLKVPTAKSDEIIKKLQCEIEEI